MKIYISHSTSFNFKKELYQPLKMTGLSYDFIFPHEKSRRQYPVKKLFYQKKCDLVIAEISFPSTGQGIELGWANVYKIPIICIYKKGSNYSKSLTTIIKNFIEYTDTRDLVKKIEKIKIL